MQLISTKLKMPEPRKKYIVRKELFLKLKFLSEYKVVVVKAGAGAGKTTLITSFMKENSISNSSWVSLDENSNDVFMFWNYFVEALKNHLGEAKEAFITAYASNFQKDNFENIITLLVNTLDIDEEIFITLDDFHHITDKFLISTIDFFLKNLSSNVHVILLTREEPLIYLGAINMEGKLLYIYEDELKLNLEESTAFINNTLDLNLSNKALDYINNLTEGWIGGIQLVVAASKGKSENELCNLSLENKVVAEYLTREIFNDLSEKEKSFLVLTSILSYFSEEICSKLIQDIDYKKIISSLLQRNLLIIIIDEENGLYRYHNILGEYLKSKFAELNKEVRNMYHSKASNIFKELGDFDQCLNHLFLCKDYSSAMKFILELPQTPATFSYMSRVPVNYILENRDFAYQRFFYHYANMENDECREIYELIENNLKNDPTFDAFKWSYMFVEDTFRANEIKIMSLTDIDKLPLNEITKAFMLIKDASFLYAQYKFHDALNFIDKAFGYSKKYNNIFIDFFALSIKAQILEEMGDLNLCLNFYKEMHKIISLKNSPSMLTTSFFIGITGAYLKKLDIAEAKKSLEVANEYGKDKLLSVDRGYRYNLSEYYFVTGNIKKATELLYGLMHMETYGNTFYLAQLLKYVLSFCEVDRELLEHFLEDYENTSKNHTNLEADLLYYRILFNNNKTLEAMDKVDELLKYCRKNEFKFKLIEASIFKIRMLLQLKENKREIINLFREALYYSFKDNIKLPFYFERETVLKVFKQHLTEIQAGLTLSEKKFLEDIKSLCGYEAKNILSDREIEVLKEMSTGISNKEIGEKLCISLATVKSHIINIYSKLQVKSRVAAVEAGKEMKLL